MACKYYTPFHFTAIPPSKITMNRLREAIEKIEEGQRVFVACLDWGLGHATRMNPVIRELSKKHTVVLGVSAPLQAYFEKNFPGLTQVVLPSYRIRYSIFLPVWLKILFNWPRIRLTIREEHKFLQEIVLEQKISVVISDSRFGLYSSACHNIIVSHQLQLQVPFNLALPVRKNIKLLMQFDEIWVPDNQTNGKGLAGKLSSSEGYPLPVRYLGPLSALSTVEEQADQGTAPIVIILSGPEPQRTKLEVLLVNALRTFPTRIILIRGTENGKNKWPDHFEVFDRPDAEVIRKYLKAAEIVICRSGYSTLMDLDYLNKKRIILIPTPGQTEQEYLADHWQRQFGAMHLKQREVSKKLLTLLKTH